MRFNEKELSQIAAETGRERFEKEGILFIRERQETFLDLFIAQPEVFVERWCRLRGNLLFYFKTKDWKATTANDVAGVFVLERFDIQVGWIWGGGRDGGGREEGKGERGWEDGKEEREREKERERER